MVHDLFHVAIRRVVTDLRIGVELERQHEIGASAFDQRLDALGVAFLTAVSYSELARIFPDGGTGSCYYFAEKAFTDKLQARHRRWARSAKLLTGWAAHLFYWVYPGVMVAFMAVLVPVYWHYYGPTNFLYFCDVSLFLILAALWLESPLLASMCAVGLLLPQTLWVVDFILNIFGIHLTGMTDYMFKHENSLFLRGLSLFHGWLPFLLLFLVKRLGYDRRALPAWWALAWVLVIFFLGLLVAFRSDSATQPNAKQQEAT